MKKILLIMPCIVLMFVSMVSAMTMIASDNFTRFNSTGLGYFEWFEGANNATIWHEISKSGDANINFGEANTSDAQGWNQVTGGYTNITVGYYMNCSAWSASGDEDRMASFMLGGNSSDEVCGVGASGHGIANVELDLNPRQGTTYHTNVSLELNQGYYIVANFLMDGVNSKSTGVWIGNLSNASNGFQKFYNTSRCASAQGFGKFVGLRTMDGSPVCRWDNFVLYEGAPEEYEEQFNAWLGYTPPLILNFYDENSGKRLGGEIMDVYLERTGFNHLYSGITDNPYSITGLNSGVYLIKVSSANYPNREYRRVTVSNITSTNLDIYLINDTLGFERTFTVRDSSSNNLEDVNVKFRRLINSTWVTVSEEETDYAGATKLYLDPNYEYEINFSKTGYKTKVINLEPTDSSYIVYLDSGEEVTPPLVEMINIKGIDSNLTYDYDTRLFTFTWYDPNNVSTEFGFQIFDGNETYYKNNSVSNNHVMTFIVEDKNTTYTAVGTAKGSSTRIYPLNSMSIDLTRYAHTTFGEDSIMIALIAILTLTLIGLFKPIAALILGGFGLGSLYLFGILPVGVASIVGMFAIIVALVVTIRRNQGI